MKFFDYGQSQRSAVRVNGQRSKSMVRVNGQRMMCADLACVTSPRAYVAGREVQQAHGARKERGTGAWGRVRIVADTGGAWWRVAARGGAWQRVEARAREAETLAGA